MRTRWKKILPPELRLTYNYSIPLTLSPLASHHAQYKRRKVFQSGFRTRFTAKLHIFLAYFILTYISSFCHLVRQIGIKMWTEDQPLLAFFLHSTHTFGPLRGIERIVWKTEKEDKPTQKASVSTHFIRLLFIQTFIQFDSCLQQVGHHIQKIRMKKNEREWDRLRC